jgi:hypothetical protein
LYKAIEMLFNYSFLKVTALGGAAPTASLAASTCYSETQVHVEGGANEALYPVRQDGFDNSSHTPNSTATSATLNPSRNFIFVPCKPSQASSRARRCERHREGNDDVNGLFVR